MNEPKKIDKRENLKTVTSNNFITAKGLEKLSLKARKMLYIAISQCRKGDKDFFSYSISVKDFAELMNIKPQAVCRSPRGSVDWNCWTPQSFFWQCSRSPRGSVDWNYSQTQKGREICVAPLAGEWIEIFW